MQLSLQIKSITSIELLFQKLNHNCELTLEVLNNNNKSYNGLWNALFSVNLPIELIFILPTAHRPLLKNYLALFNGAVRHYFTRILAELCSRVSNWAVCWWGNKGCIPAAFYDSLAYCQHWQNIRRTAEQQVSVSICCKSASVKTWQTL